MSFYCYKFPSRETFRTLAAAEGLINADGDLITSSPTFAIFEAGVLFTKGVYNAEGELITPPVELPGYHVNTLVLAPEAWDPYLVIVNSPEFVWQGCPTQAPTSDILEELMQ
jgi:hypothetical protein